MEINIGINSNGLYICLLDSTGELLKKAEGLDHRQLTRLLKIYRKYLTALES